MHKEGKDVQMGKVTARKLGMEKGKEKEEETRTEGRSYSGKCRGEGQWRRKDKERMIGEYLYV